VFRDVDVSGSKPTIEREGFRQMPEPTQIPGEGSSQGAELQPIPTKTKDTKPLGSKP